MLWSAAPNLLIGMVFVRLLRSVTPFGIVWIPKYILDGVVKVQHGQGDTHKVITLIFLELSLVAASDLLARINNFLDILIGDRFTDHVAILLMRQSMRLDLAYLEDPSYYDTLTRVRAQSTSRLWLLASVLNSLQEFLTLIILVAGLGVFSPWLMALLIVSTVPAFLCEAWCSKINYSALFQRTPQRRMLEYLRYLLTCVETAKEVRVFDLGEYIISRYSRLARELYEQNKTFVRNRALGGWLFGLISLGAYYIGYLKVAHAAFVGALSLGTFTFLIGAFSRARSSTERIFANVNEISEQATFLSDLLAFLSLQPRNDTKINVLPAPRTMQGGIEFQHVSFAYAGTGKLALDNLNLRLFPAQHLALVGRNGAGKTTLVKLLCRLYEPTSGRIVLNGVDIREYDIKDYRRQVSAIFQDFVRFDWSLRENIALGNNMLVHNDDRLRQAIKDSGCSKLVESLPLGIDQPLGRQFAGSRDLSGGEWQKVALARAFSREAQIYVLDEPTASIDAQAESEIYSCLEKVTTGRMAIFISHKLSNLHRFDNIAVLDEGGIREEGSHSHLVARGGLYANLYKVQAKGYSK